MCQVISEPLCTTVIYHLLGWPNLIWFWNEFVSLAYQNLHTEHIFRAKTWIHICFGANRGYVVRYPTGSVQKFLIIPNTTIWGVTTSHSENNLIHPLNLGSNMP